MASRLGTGAVVLAMVGLLALSEQAAQAVKQGLQLCAASVIPSLFPFLVLSTLLADTGGVRRIAAPLEGTVGRLLGISGTGLGVFLLSLLGGYPVGPRLTAQLLRAGQLSRAEAEHLLHFCNNAGPAFILGLAGLGQLHSFRAGAALCLLHAGTALLVALLLRPGRPFSAPAGAAVPPKPWAQALVDAIGSAGTSTVQLCAAVTFFCTVLQLLAQLTGIAHPLALGFAELTQGIVRLRADTAGFVMAAALLGWGGLSVHCQAAAVLAGSGLSLRGHLWGKALQCGLSTLLAALLAPIFAP